MREKLNVWFHPFLNMKTRELSTPAKPNKQVKEYLGAYEKGLKARYVIPNGKGWYVAQPTKSKGQLFATKKAAIAGAEQELTKTKGELFIFDKHGRLVSRSTPS